MKLKSGIVATALIGCIFCSNAYAIDKIDESSIPDQALKERVAENIDIVKDRKLGYPSSEFSTSNIHSDGKVLTVNNAKKILSIADNGICRVLNKQTKEGTESYVVVKYDDTIVTYYDIKDFKPLNDGGIVNLGNVIGDATEFKMTIKKKDKYIDPYVLLFNSLYPRGGMKIPLFSQMDDRWKNDPYGDSSILIAGCGPSALSMVFSYFEEDIITPRDFVKSIGGAHSKYMVSGQGSSWNIISDECKKRNLISKEIKSNEIKDALNEGKPVIALMGNGYFTNAGHFIVLRGVDKNGNILVNDPADIKQNFKKTFSINMLERQYKQFWSIEKGENNVKNNNKNKNDNKVININNTSLKSKKGMVIICE